jgi:hypothetical protein
MLSSSLAAASRTKRSRLKQNVPLNDEYQYVEQTSLWGI